jgi:hypothetical protein
MAGGSTASRSRSPPAVARSTTARAQLAIGEQTTTIYADPAQVTQPQQTPCRSPDPRVPGTAQFQLLKTSYYVQRFADPTLAAKFVLRASPASTRIRKRADVPAEHGRRTGDRLRGHRQHRARRAESVQQAAVRQAGKQTIVRDQTGARSTISATLREGNDIFTTIDHTIQANAGVTAQHHRPVACQSATAVVINLKTGEVLALAQALGYNANNASNAVRGAAHRSVTDNYEPGSTFKLVTISAALSVRSYAREVHAAVQHQRRRRYRA